ncbi:MAG: flavin reductase family protein [Candidatus Bathyarchaeota archaeon]
MEKKVDVQTSSALRLIHPMHTVLLSCAPTNGTPNIITLAWAMPASINPPLVAVSIAPGRYSYGLIEETKEFVINIPTMKILKETFFCGRKSGKNINKFKETGLTPEPAKKVLPPIIKECIAHLECKLYDLFKAGDHVITVGRVVDAYANEDMFTKTYNLEKARLIYHLGGKRFTTLDPEVIEPDL